MKKPQTTTARICARMSVCVCVCVRMCCVLYNILGEANQVRTRDRQGHALSIAALEGTGPKCHNIIVAVYNLKSEFF